MTYISGENYPHLSDEEFIEKRKEYRKCCKKGDMSFAITSYMS